MDKDRILDKIETAMNEDEDSNGLASDPLDLMTTAVRVHTKDADLNEDATLANLSAEHTKLSKFIQGNLEILAVLRSYLKVDKKIIREKNIIGQQWGEDIIYMNPEKKHFEELKGLLLNRCRSIMILSRSIKGAPLKSFLTYGRNTTDKELGLQQKLSMWDKLRGVKPQDDTLESAL